MPRGFYFPSPEYRAWRPLVLDPDSPVYRGRGWLVLFGRVKPLTTAGALAADVQAIARALGERFTYSAAWGSCRSRCRPRSARTSAPRTWTAASPATAPPTAAPPRPAP